MCLQGKIVESCSARGKMACLGEKFGWDGLGDKMKLWDSLYWLIFWCHAVIFQKY